MGEDVTLLAEMLGAPVICTPCGKGVPDERHRLAGGCRLHQRLAFDDLCAHADGLLLLGTKLSPTDFWSFHHHSDVPIPFERFGSSMMHIDVDSGALEQVGVHEAGGVSLLVSDISSACQELLLAFEQLGSSGKSSPWDGKPELAVSALKK